MSGRVRPNSVARAPESSLATPEIDVPGGPGDSGRLRRAEAPRGARRRPPRREVETRRRAARGGDAETQGLGPRWEPVSAACRGPGRMGGPEPGSPTAAGAVAAGAPGGAGVKSHRELRRGPGAE
ncbi:hypothetical protein NDU88_004800 [Pleurodeles waltl]|uniref:Uncharacterized protein n=1 Tax=Pleurodeles waltl TaxID=8319 RepID=A0AAV7PGQ8_PLEWA|nr:hypothetical protein NDU88_004800 [Pleurodeles waltl]